MTPRKLRVAFVSFPYGGTGNSSSTHPDVEQWIAKAAILAKQDERISDVLRRDFSDTPVTMTRNAAVDFCQSAGVDVLIMVDSDQAPDLYWGTDPTARQFFPSSFDFLYAHYEKGPVAIVAPYCGPPAHPVYGGGEIPYVFRWANQNNGEPSPGFRQERYSREEVSNRTGFEEISSGPTGCCMIDMRCFDLLKVPYFYYEYAGDGVACPNCHQPKPGKRSEKSGTEDCAFFRDLSLNCQEQSGYNCVFVNWDAWAGHWKPKCVGKPELIRVDQVSQTLREVVLRNQPTGRAIRIIRPSGKLPVHPADANGVKFGIPPERRMTLNGNGKGVPISPSGTPVNRISEKAIPPEHKSSFANDHIGSSLTLRVGEKGVNEEGVAYEVVHPDDTRLTDVPVDVVDGRPVAFREIHNTHPEDLEILLGAVRQRAVEADLEQRTVRIVELGSWVGHTAVMMAKEAEKYADYEIHCIDHFEGGNTLQRRVAEEHDVYAEFLSNTAPFGRKIIPHRSDTQAAAIAWSQRELAIRDIDFLFIDADHSYEGCLADILNWWPFVRHGCTIVGHDFNCLFPGVIRAAIECFGWGVAHERYCWIVKKGVDKLLLPETVYGKELVPA